MKRQDSAPGASRGWLEASEAPGPFGQRLPAGKAAEKGRRRNSSAPETSGPRFKVLSYNVLAQRKLKGPKYGYCDGADINWRQRKQRLLKEVLAQEPDVLCLQEVDNYDLWWQPQLSRAGYDGIYTKRGRRHEDGVATFYSRSKFQLFRSETIDFNNAGEFLGEERPSCRLQQDNVGIIVAIQPWEDSDHPSALVITNVQLVSPSTADLINVQRKQVLMLVRTVERFNADFQLPVIMCGSFNFLQQSELYTLVTRGKFPHELRKPSTIEERPEAKVVAQSHVRVRWRAPAPGDAALQGYVIRRRCGGNTSRGFDDPAFFPLSAIDNDGPWREANMSGLGAGLTYEFVVAGVSAVGQAEFSQPCAPVTTNGNTMLPPLNHVLKHPTEPAEVILQEPVETLDQWVDASLWEGSDKAQGGFELDISLTPKYEDRTLNLDINPTRSQIGGSRHAGLVHMLNVGSAYASLQDDYEPPYTLNTERFRGCVDYIFFSREQLRPERVLEISDSASVIMPKADIRRPQLIDDIHDALPSHWDPDPMHTELNYELGDTKNVPNRAYTGAWQPRKRPNENLFHKWFPNTHHPSDHISLLCEFSFSQAHLASRWS